MEFTAKQIAQLIEGRVEGDEMPLSTHLQRLKRERKVPSPFFPIRNINIIYTTPRLPLFWWDESLELEHEVKTTLIPRERCA